jgi:hypothetical protein
MLDERVGTAAGTVWNSRGCVRLCSRQVDECIIALVTRLARTVALARSWHVESLLKDMLRSRVLLVPARQSTKSISLSAYRRARLMQVHGGTSRQPSS